MIERMTGQLAALALGGLLVVLIAAIPVRAAGWKPRCPARSRRLAAPSRRVVTALSSCARMGSLVADSPNRLGGGSELGEIAEKHPK